MCKKLNTVFVMLSLGVVFLLCGCGNGSHSPDLAEGIPEGVFIDEQILLETSELAEGIVGPEETVFDLAHIQMVQDGTFNDLEISYWTGSSCDEDAWDGDHLLVASDSLYTIAVNGEVLAAYALPVANVQDIAWDGEALWLLNRGLTDLQSRDQVVTRFRLR